MPLKTLIENAGGVSFPAEKAAVQEINRVLVIIEAHGRPTINDLFVCVMGLYRSQQNHLSQK